MAVSHTSKFCSGFSELEVHDLFVCMLPVKHDISKANISLPPAINPYYTFLYNSVQKQKYRFNQYYCCHSLMVYCSRPEHALLEKTFPFKESKEQFASPPPHPSTFYLQSFSGPIDLVGGGLLLPLGSACDSAAAK